MHPLRLLALLLALLLPAAARAGGALGPAGEPIRTSSYALDYFTGPVMSSARVTGLGGAFAGIAEGVDADPINAAAPGVRVPWDYSWYDYDVSLGISLPGFLRPIDFENSEDAEYEYQQFYTPTIGLNLALGRAALGAFFESRKFELHAEPTLGTSQTFAATLSSVHMLLAYALLRGQLVVGLGWRGVHFSLTDEDSGKQLLAANSGIFASDFFSRLDAVGMQAGVLLQPDRLPLRFGLSARSGLSAPATAKGITRDAEGDLRLGGLYLPERIELPWEIETGFAWELGRRPLNGGWLNPDDYILPLVEEIRRSREGRRLRGSSGSSEAALRAAEDELLKEQKADLRERRRAGWRQTSRSRWLLSASVLISGPVSEGVALSAFLRQRVQRSGTGVTYSPRLGLEAEPVGGWLQVRVGSYLEPARLSGSRPRPHGTAGFDLKVLPWDVFGLYDEGTWWSVGAVVDLAERYRNLALRVGVWH